MLNPGQRLMSLPYIVRQAARFTAAAAIVGTLAGCQGIAGSASLSQVRIIDASPDAPGLDIYQGSDALAYNLGLGTITSYVPIAPGTYTTAAASAGTRQVLSSSKATFAASSQYTVLIGNSAAGPQHLVLKDQSQPAPPGQIAIRFINQAARISAVDVYLVPAGQKLAAVTPVVTGHSFGANTGYLNIPTGTYTLVMAPAGTAVASYAGAQVTYPGGAARTIILIDQQLITTPGLQVITANDYDSPTVTN